MEVTGINRVLLKHSLFLANDPSSLASVPGLTELKDKIGPDPRTGLPVTEETYGYYWGPRLNAAGRMANADDALNLLLATDEIKAAKPVRACMKWNSWRKATELAMGEEARIMAVEQNARTKPSIITLCKPTWHPGVVGIVASRIREQYGRAAIVASVHPDPKKPGKGIWKGSGRSVKGLPMGSIFHQASKEGVIVEGGGHPMAGGLSFREKQRVNLHAELASRAPGELAPVAPSVEMVASASSFYPFEWAAIFRRLAPFGNGNPPPALIVEQAELLGIRVRTRLDRPPLLTQQTELASPGSFGGPNRKPSRGAVNDTQGSRSSYWAFAQTDVKDLVLLLNRLREKSDPMSAYVRDQLDPDAAQALEKFENFSRDSERLRAALIDSLNQIITTSTLFDPDRLDGIRLRGETKLIAQQNPTGQKLLQLNRLLLEDVFPKELVRREIQRTRRVWAYQGNFEDRITGRYFTALWSELEEAEVLWQVHRFLDPKRTKEDGFELPHVFRLHLELRSFVPSEQWSNIYRGRRFKHDYCFKIRQCIPFTRGPIGKLRMPVVRER
jgi:hypothetical protein